MYVGNSIVLITTNIFFYLNKTFLLDLLIFIFSKPSAFLLMIDGSPAAIITINNFKQTFGLTQWQISQLCQSLIVLGIND